MPLGHRGGVPAFGGGDGSCGASGEIDGAGEGEGGSERVAVGFGVGEEGDCFLVSDPVSDGFGIGGGGPEVGGVFLGDGGGIGHVVMVYDLHGSGGAEGECAEKEVGFEEG